jgi:dienelactone hydrolase
VHSAHLGDGAVPPVEEGTETFRLACISAEFRAFSSNESSPVTQWLRKLAKLAHGECGGPGVGAIGMCFTGNFALSMMLEASVLAPVMNQPSLPLNDPAGIGLAPEELTAIRNRLEADDLTVMAYRFDGDRFCTAQRLRPMPQRSATDSKRAYYPTQRRPPMFRRSSKTWWPVRTAW